MTKIEKKHSFASRWMHWINFPVLMLMIWSGALIYWSNDIYSIKIFGYELFHFFPQGFYDFTGINNSLAEGMSIHFFLMWFFTINGFLYVVYTFISGEWRDLVPTVSSFKEAIQVMLHDLHLSKYHPPQVKYNGAQRIAYSSIILMGAGSVLTGLAIYKPVQFSWLTAIFFGYEWARWLHFWLTVGYVLFFFVHIAQVVKTGWNNFRSMVSGYEYVYDTPETAGENLSIDSTPIIEEGSAA